MRFLIQCVDEASVQVDENVTGAIEKGFLVFIGVSDTDDTQTADRMIKKMLGLRVFEDENHKTNLSLSDVKDVYKRQSLCRRRSKHRKNVRIYEH